MHALPEDFLRQMRHLLADQFSAFLATYQQPPQKSLRINSLKINSTISEELLPFQLEPVPWNPMAYYYDSQKDQPGKHVYHAAGLYYIQEASAMAPVICLDPQPGEKVLDLCAAPGGKTTQIAAMMEGEGVLVANEIEGKRVSALIENVERCGVPHATILNERPERLTTPFQAFFDRILIDAPCSGEGMFRKDVDTRSRWSVRSTEKSAELQGEILESASIMLRPGGRMVYSTCTFNLTENEQVIEQFLQRHPDFTCIQPSISHWTSPGYDADGKTARLWPHHLRGEGHFVAVLYKNENASPTQSRAVWKYPRVEKNSLQQYQHFTQEHLGTDLGRGSYTQFGEHLYQLPTTELPSLQGLKVKRPGLYLGQVKRSHFQPSHALALVLKNLPKEKQINLASNDPTLYRYLQGETLPSSRNGWQWVTVDSFPIGWGKANHGLLKNHYPKRLRWNPL